jgi:shikimate kinase
MRISLVSMPGGGKSTVGRQLAKRLQITFFDTDGVIEQRIGRTIREFFESEGEAAFRDIEAEVLAELLRPGLPPAVVSTGGGSVLRPANRALLRERSCVLYLHTTPRELFRRLRNDTQRPLLQTADPLARLYQMAEQREPLYRETAHFVLEVGRPSVPLLVNTILMQLEVSGYLDKLSVPPPVAQEAQPARDATEPLQISDAS